MIPSPGTKATLLCAKLRFSAMSGGSGRRSVPTPCLSSQPAQARCRCDPFLFAAGQKIDQHAAYQGKNAGSVSLSDRSRDVSLCIDQQIQPVSGGILRRNPTTDRAHD